MGTYAEKADNYIKNLISKGSKVPVDIDSSYEMKLPKWAEEEKMKRARQLWSEHYYAMMNGCLTGLLCILAIPSILNILIFTKKSSSTYTAYKRYIQTVFHTLAWFRADLRPGTTAWKSIEAVRKFHFNASSSAEKQKVGIVSQKDMAATQYAFMGVIVLTGDKLGVYTDDESYASFVHFWKVLGHLLGIHEEFNICADSYEETLERLKRVRDQIIAPAMQFPQKEFSVMSHYVVDGLWCFNPSVDYDSFVYFAKRLLNISGYHYFASEVQGQLSNYKELEKMSWMSRWNLFYHIVVNEYLLKFTWFRWYINTQTIFSEWLITYFPFLAFYLFGIKRAYVRILKGDD